ncbi:unnamed protein product, partial [marine sediment metagenome]
MQFLTQAQKDWSVLMNTRVALTPISISAISPLGQFLRKLGLFSNLSINNLSPPNRNAFAKLVYESNFG